MKKSHGSLREKINKKAEWTTLILIDSQAVKNTCNTGSESLLFWFLQSQKRDQKTLSCR